MKIKVQVAVAVTKDGEYVVCGGGNWALSMALATSADLINRQVGPDAIYVREIEIDIPTPGGPDA